MNNGQLLISLSVLLLLIGCNLTQPVELEIAWEEDALAIQGLLSAQDGIRVEVGRIISPNQPNQSTLVENVEVAVYRDGAYWVDLIPLSTSQFSLPTGVAVEAGRTYALEVVAPGYPTATTAYEEALPAVLLSTLEFTADSIALRWGFQDDAHRINYYQYEVNPLYQGEDQHRFNLQWFISPIGVFDDETWNGQYYLEDAQYTSYARYEEDGIRLEAPIDSVGVTLYSLSPHLAAYFDGLETQVLGDGITFLDPEPLPQNVAGGYGFWGSYAVTSRFLSY